MNWILIWIVWNASYPTAPGTSSVVFKEKVACDYAANSFTIDFYKTNSKNNFQFKLETFCVPTNQKVAEEGK